MVGEQPYPMIWLPVGAGAREDIYDESIGRHLTDPDMLRSFCEAIIEQNYKSFTPLFLSEAAEEEDGDFAAGSRPTSSTASSPTGRPRSGTSWRLDGGAFAPLIMAGQPEAAPMKLYQTYASPFPTRVRLLIYAKGLDVEIIEPPGFHASTEAKGAIRN